MPIHSFPPASPDTCSFIEVLTAESTGKTIGYRLGGARPGPNALVATYAMDMEVLVEKLAALPTLPWMWGSLYLVSLDALDETHSNDVKNCIPDVAFDETIIFPPGNAEVQYGQTGDAYVQTLRMCKGMGMIQGRGVI